MPQGTGYPNQGLQHAGQQLSGNVQNIDTSKLVAAAQALERGEISLLEFNQLAEGEVAQSNREFSGPGGLQQARAINASEQATREAPRRPSSVDIANASVPGSITPSEIQGAQAAYTARTTGQPQVEGTTQRQGTPSALENVEQAAFGPTAMDQFADDLVNKLVQALGNQR